MIDRIIAGAVGWAASVFYDVEQIGGPIPDGPVLITANHPNALLDPLLIFRTAGRVSRPLAKAPLFEQVFVGSMLRGLGGLPVYRRQDNVALMHKNDDTFRKAVDALRQGDAVQIFPEGRSHSEPGIVELKTGAARIALDAQRESGWNLGLHIVPLGITYRRKAFFRGRALVIIGTPFRIEDLKQQFETDAHEAARILTQRIAAGLQQATLNVTQREDEGLIEAAEALYVREKGIAQPREREPLSDRLPRMQRFADGIAYLLRNDPARLNHLRSAVARYQRTLRMLGAEDGDVPTAYEPFGVARYAIREGAYLLIGLPLALIGAILWALPYFAPRLLLRIVKPEHESVATYKMAGALLAFPAWYALLVAAAIVLANLLTAIATSVIAPLLGLITIAWFERWRRVHEDIRLFFRVLLRPGDAKRLVLMRQRLASEFDSVLSEMTRL